MAMKVEGFHQWLIVSLVCAVLGTSGCGGKRPPTELLSQAELAVQEANKSTASKHAARELQTAKEQLNDAKRAVQAKEYNQARRLAEQAIVNAQLAESTATAESTRQAAEELRTSIEALRNEVNRKFTGN